jgi:hypothetical protein
LEGYLCENGHVNFERVAPLLERLSLEEDSILQKRIEKDERFRQNRIRQKNEEEDFKRRKEEQIDGNLGGFEGREWSARDIQYLTSGRGGGRGGRGGGGGGGDRNITNESVAEELKRSMGLKGISNFFPSFPSSFRLILLEDPSLRVKQSPKEMIKDRLKKRHDDKMAALDIDPMDGTYHSS